jgi:hypothetical protein
MFTVNFFIVSFFSTKCKYALIHIHMYVVCYSNDFNLHKIRVMRNLQERNDLITRGAPVPSIDTYSYRMNIISLQHIGTAVLLFTKLLQV